jgi:hypothetical protein
MRTTLFAVSIVTVAALIACSSSSSSSCSDVHGTWSITGGSCGLVADCAVNQSGCSLSLSCVGGDTATGSVAGTTLTLTVGVPPSGVQNCKGDATGGAVSLMCTGNAGTQNNGTQCSVSGTFVGASGSSGGSSGGSTDAGSPMTDAQCNALATQQCVDCCVANHQSSYVAFIDAYLNCACTSPGVCKTSCATTFCAATPSSPATGTACDSCLLDSVAADAGGQCLTPLRTACPSGGVCDPFLACDVGCP